MFLFCWVSWEMKSSVRAHPTPQSPPPVSPLPSSRNLHTPCFLLKTTCLGSTGGGVNGVIDGVIVVEELEEEEHRDRDLGLPYFTSCVRAGCHQKEYWCCSSVCVLNTPTLRLCPLNSTTTSVSKGLSPTLFLSLSFSTTHLPSPTLLSALSFAHFHSRTFSHSVPPLCVPPPPPPLSCFPHTLCMCLCHVVDRPSLWPLQYVRYMEKKTLWCAYWVGLGILSSVGLGTGLHTFLLYLVRKCFL